MIKDENINCTIEALILASPEPVSVKRLSETVDNISPARIRQSVDDLNNIYMGCGNSFRIREVAGGYQIHILPDFEQIIKKLLVKQRKVRLSRPALETLAIIAYKQPVTKIEIEHIRGVATDGVIHNLLQRELIVISGRAETPGRPLLYKTSNEFLKYFGLNRLSDLPRMDEIEEMIRLAEAPKEQTVLPLNGEESEFAEMQASAEDLEEGNGNRLVDEMIATADISDLMTGLDANESEDIIDPQLPSGGNGSGDVENIGATAEAEEVDQSREEEADQVILPTYYDPIPDEPPSIKLSTEASAEISEIEDNTNREAPPDGDETVVKQVESLDTGEPPSND